MGIPTIATRPDTLITLLLATAKSPTEKYVDWDKVDEAVEQLAQVLLATIADVEIDTFAKRPRDHQAEKLEPKILAAQSSYAKNMLYSLPLDGHGFAREVDMGDVHLHPVRVKIYEKTRALLLNVVAKSWATATDSSTEAIDFKALMEIMDGPYGELAVAAIRKADGDADQARVARALEMLFKSTSPEARHNVGDAFDSLAIRWVKAFPARWPLMQLIGLHQAHGGAPLSTVGCKLMEDYAKSVAHLEAVAESFFECWGFNRDDWAIKEVDVAQRAVHVVRTVQVTYDTADNLKRNIRERRAQWQSPDPEITLHIMIRRVSFNNDTLETFEAD